eukprot:25400-Prymnesium_polylepis.2
MYSLNPLSLPRQASNSCNQTAAAFVKQFPVRSAGALAGRRLAARLHVARASWMRRRGRRTPREGLASVGRVCCLGLGLRQLKSISAGV